MGVGNWSIQSKFASDVVHVDANTESFKDCREEATQCMRAWLATAHPELFAQFGEGVTLEDVEDLIPRVELNELFMDAGIYSWDDEAEFVRDASANRYENLVLEIQGAFRKAFPLADVSKWPLSREKRAGFLNDAAASTLVETALACVVLREWESSLCIGIAPNNKLENSSFDHSINVLRAELEKFLARVWSVCDPENESFRASSVANDVIAEELRPIEKTLQQFGKDVSFKLLRSMLDRILVRANAAVDSDTEDDFNATFGYEANCLIRADRDGALNESIEFMSDFGGTNAMVEARYLTEFNNLQYELLNTLASMGEEVYRATGAWTSQLVDLSPYRDVVALQIDQALLAKFIATPDFSEALRTSLPSRYSTMGESTFNRTVVGAIDHRFPFKLDLPSQSKLVTVHLRAKDDLSSGVAVWRGDMEWLGINPQFEQNNWMKDPPSVQLGELPGWMTLVTSEEDIRSALESLGAPAAAAREFFTPDGQCDVTGVLAETRDGDYGAFYVCHGSRPFDNSALYYPVQLNGRFVEPAPVLSQESNHG